MELSKFQRIPWNFPIDLESSMEFHGSSGEFHGIPWNCEILILINCIIGEVYFTVCCMISCHCISDNPLVIEILRYFISKATFWRPSFCSNGDIPFWIYIYIYINIYRYIMFESCIQRRKTTCFLKGPVTQRFTAWSRPKPVKKWSPVKQTMLFALMSNLRRATVDL